MTTVIARKDRSAFGLGWEDHRNGRPLASNPFDIEVDREKHNRWSDGWRAYKDSRDVAVVTRFPKSEKK